MKKTTVVISALVLLMMFAAVPVMAQPTKGQKVAVREYITAAFPELPPAREWVTKGGIYQMRGNQEHYTVKFVIGNAEFYFNHYLVGYGSWNTKTGVFVGHFDGLWTLVGDDSSGFSGNMEMRAYDFNPFAGTWSWWSGHEVAQGFGDFAGQTLMLSIKGPFDMAAPWTGYLLKG